MNLTSPFVVVNPDLSDWESWGPSQPHHHL